jgi:hypothetical protein
MSNIDKRALREAADKATKGKWWIDSHGHAMVAFVGNDVLDVFATDNTREAVRHEDTGNLSRWRNDNDATFIAEANPATVLALLDELEAKDRMVAELSKLLADIQKGRPGGVYFNKWDAQISNVLRAAAAGKREAS